MKRLFVALRLPQKTKQAITELQGQFFPLAQENARKARLVKATNLHVTLKFLGATPDEQIPLIKEALCQCANNGSLFCSQLQKVSAFPTIQKPRIVFVAIEQGQKRVIQLMHSLDNALAPHGFVPEKRSRHPHVTIARIEGAKYQSDLTEWLEHFPKTHFGAVDCSSLILVESQLNLQGACYSTVYQCPLGIAQK